MEHHKNGLSLRNGAMRCEIAPHLGGSVAGLWCRDTPVLQSTSAHLLPTVRQAACFALVPYSNRIGNGHMRWQEVDYAIRKNFAPEPHAIHGLGWERPWQVQQQSQTQAVLALEHSADADWPFSFNAEQTLALQPDALHMTLSITNTAARVVPAGLGWHPYFVKRKGATLSFESTGRWEMGADSLPTQRTPMPAKHYACNHLSIDHCFDGWSGVAVLEDALHCCTIRSNLSRLVAYTQPQHNCIALEPVSHVNNALQLAGRPLTLQELGVHLLQPGETWACHMHISVEAR